MWLNLRGFWPPRRLGVLPPPDLTPYYGIGPGQIAVHFDASRSTRNAEGRITALQNLGGAGQVFDAAVSGAAIPVSADGRSMQLQGNVTGYPVLANPINLVGVRLMMVLDVPAYPNGLMALFGGAVAGNATLNIHSDASGQTIRMFSTLTGSSIGINLPSRSKWAAGASLLEVEMTETGFTAWRNGALLGSAAHPWGTFYVTNFCKGEGPATSGVTGLVGAGLGVTLGAGADAAIAAARAYLIHTHDLVLS